MTHYAAEEYQRNLTTRVYSSSTNRFVPTPKPIDSSPAAVWGPSCSAGSAPWAASEWSRRFRRIPQESPDFCWLDLLEGHNVCSLPSGLLGEAGIVLCTAPFWFTPRLREFCPSHSLAPSLPQRAQIHSHSYIGHWSLLVVILRQKGRGPQRCACKRPSSQSSLGVMTGSEQGQPPGAKWTMSGKGYEESIMGYPGQTWPTIQHAKGLAIWKDHRLLFCQTVQHKSWSNKINLTDRLFSFCGSPHSQIVTRESRLCRISKLTSPLPEVLNPSN